MAGDAAAYQAMRQMQAQQRAQREARDDRRRQQAARRPRDHEATAEPMACPACRAEYAFGNACPVCDVRLVGASMDAEARIEPASPAPPTLARRLARGAAMAAVGLVSVELWLRLIYWGG